MIKTLDKEILLKKIQKKYSADRERQNETRPEIFHLKVLDFMVKNPKSFSFSTIIYILSKSIRDKKIIIRSNILDYITMHDVEKIEVEQNTITIWANFCNFIGTGPMPFHIKERIRRSPDYNAIKDFFDIIQNRFMIVNRDINGLYQGVTQNSLPDLRLSSFSGSLAHIACPKERLISIYNQYAYQFWSKARNKYGLKFILEDFFKLAIRVTDKNPRSVSLDREILTRLGSDYIYRICHQEYSFLNKFLKKDFNNILGENALLGRHAIIHDMIHVIVNVTFNDLIKFLPDHFSQSLKKLINIVQKYVCYKYKFKVLFRIKKQEVSSRSMLLGWTSLLKSVDNEDYYMIAIEDDIYYDN